MTAACRSFFLDAGPRGQRLCVFYAAQGVATPLGQVLLLPPFGEELNKSRRMLALGSRAFAAAGFDVLMMDLLGCGDSSGDFGDATWDDWQQDIKTLALQSIVDLAPQSLVDLAPQSLRSCPQGAPPSGLAKPVPRAWLGEGATAEPGGRETRPPLWLWGVRAGALLVPAALEAALGPVNLLLWQPVTAGKLQLQQFLRLKVAADLVGGQAKGAMQALRDQLQQGQSVEIAGYQLSPALAAGLEQAQLKPPAAAQGTSGNGPVIEHVVWMETSLREEPALSPAGSSATQAWTAAGCEVHAQAVRGPSFWAASEIEVAPDLIAASVQALLQATQAGTPGHAPAADLPGTNTPADPDARPSRADTTAPGVRA